MTGYNWLSLHALFVRTRVDGNIRANICSDVLLLSIDAETQHGGPRHPGPVTTRNEATPGNEAKKTLPENVANFVGGYIFWEPHTQK